MKNFGWTRNRCFWDQTEFLNFQYFFFNTATIVSFVRCDLFGSLERCETCPATRRLQRQPMSNDDAKNQKPTMSMSQLVVHLKHNYEFICTTFKHLRAGISSSRCTSTIHCTYRQPSDISAQRSARRNVQRVAFPASFCLTYHLQACHYFFFWGGGTKISKIA